jgi:hypothetical protein
MQNQKIDKLLEQVTEGLEADLEVRLDVTNELRAHFEDKVEEYQAYGKSEIESEEAALKSFGDTIQVADGLIEANISRMKLKARLRIIAWAMLIPAVIVCALVSFELGTDIPAGITILNNMMAKKSSGSDRRWLWERYTPEQKLILYGDRNRKTYSEQQKAILEKYPDDKMFRANYILALLSDYSRKRVARESVMRELDKAKTLDTENALYNYLTAGLMLNDACEVKEEPASRWQPSPVWHAFNHVPYALIIKDRKKMNQAVQEFLAGTRKKSLNSYCSKLLRRRLDIMGMPRTWIENIIQISVMAGTRLPQTTYYLEIPKKLWKYAEILQKEGREQEVLQIIKPWKSYLRQISKDTGSLIGALGDMAVAEMAKNQIPAIYRRAGKVEAATKVDIELKKITAVHKNWINEKSSSEMYYNKYHKNISVVGAMMMPALKGEFEFTPKDFATGRKIEYIAAEKFGLLLQNTIFILGIIGSMLFAIIWRIRSRQQAILLAPTPKVTGNALFFGIILPLSVYMLISQLGIVGGHSYNIAVNAVNFMAQLILLYIFIPSLIFIIIKKHIKLRCLDLGVAIPAKKTNKTRNRKWLLPLLIIGLVALFPFGLFYKLHLKNDLLAPGPSAMLVVALLVIAGLLISACISAMRSNNKYALYYGALARSLTPVLALAIIFITVVIMPYLSWREADLIRQDKVIFGQPKSTSHIEGLVVQRLKKKLLEAIGD